MSYFRWMLYYRCELHSFNNATTCADLYGKLPECLDSISMAFQNSTVHNRRLADQTCGALYVEGQNDTLTENISRHCDAKDDIAKCYPSFNWLPSFLNSNETRKVLGVPDFVTFKSLNVRVLSLSHPLIGLILSPEQTSVFPSSMYNLVQPYHPISLPVFIFFAAAAAGYLSDE